MSADKDGCKLDLTGKSMSFALSWKKFDFVITPSEFRSVFSRDDFVFLADRVREKTQSKIISKDQVLTITRGISSELSYARMGGQASFGMMRCGYIS